MRDTCFFAVMVFVPFGSQITRSASEPGITAPFLGYILRMRAMLVDVAATNSSLVSRPVLTPAVHKTGMRSPRPPVPFGILVKSLAPIRFCLMVNEQWSVATTDSVPDCKPAHSESWCLLARNGGDITRPAA